MLNSIGFYKGIFLHVILVGIIVPSYIVYIVSIKDKPTAISPLGGPECPHKKKEYININTMHCFEANYNIFFHIGNDRTPNLLLTWFS